MGRVASSVDRAAAPATSGLSSPRVCVRGDPEQSPLKPLVDSMTIFRLFRNGLTDLK